VRGRKPKTAARQIAEGDPSRRGKRKLEERLESEPKAARGLPGCPKHLKGRARKAWRFWVAELEGMNLDCRPDAPMLEGACASYGTYADLQVLIEKQGHLVAKRERNPQTGQLEVTDIRPHPGLAVRDRALALMRSFCCEFGLTPVSRARLSVEPADNTMDELWEILSRPRQPRPVPGQPPQPAKETLQ
jgi:P27 family predicted phage terminase small subunit